MRSIDQSVRGRGVLTLLGALAALAALWACSNVPEVREEFAAYQPAPLREAEVLPGPAELEVDRVRVAVSTFELPWGFDRGLVQGANVPLLMASALERSLQRTGASVVDRRATEQLFDELRRGEAIGGVDLSRFAQTVDYALLAQIESLDVQVDYRRADDEKDPDTCHFSTRLQASVRAYAMDPFELVQTFSFRDSDSETVNMETPAACHSYNAVIKGLVTEVAGDTVRAGDAPLQNLFAPEAFVIERRVGEQGEIYKVSTGTEAGFAPGNEVAVFRRAVGENPLTGREQIEEAQIARGRVSDAIGGNYAWIVLRGDESAQLRLGDLVRVMY